MSHSPRASSSKQSPLAKKQHCFFVNAVAFERNLAIDGRSSQGRSLRHLDDADLKHKESTIGPLGCYDSSDNSAQGGRVPEKKVKAEIPGSGLLDGAEVPVTETTERWSEVRLEDGTVLRLKPVFISAVRIDNKYDKEGNPVYSIKVNQIMVVASAPEHLRKPAEPGAKY